MRDISNLYDFVKYCEQVPVDDDTFFLISIFASNLTKEEFLQDVEECLSIYYKWLKKAVDSEFYLMADKIWKAKNIEIQHYIDLAKATNKKYKKDIMAIDQRLKEKYLLND